MTVQPGFVYFIRCMEFVKIGSSENPKRRLASLGTMNPFDCTLLGIVEGGSILEFEIHEALAPHRHRGEWFHASPDVLALVDRLLSIGAWVEPPPRPALPPITPEFIAEQMTWLAARYKPKPRQWNFR